MPAVSLQDIYDIAKGKGFTDDEARAAVAVAKSEGAPGNTITGDYVTIGGQQVATSFGPFQFHVGGQLNNFAAFLGISIPNASAMANEQQAGAVSWALDNYLGAAIKQGAANGVTGRDLAIYASRYGQGSSATACNGPCWLNAGTAWDSLGATLDTSKPSVQTDTPGSPNPLDIPANIAAGVQGAFQNFNPFKAFFSGINPSGFIVVGLAVILIFIGAMLWQGPTIVKTTVKAAEVAGA